jgi:hypothetical protein
MSITIILPDVWPTTTLERLNLFITVTVNGTETFTRFL